MFWKKARKKYGHLTAEDADISRYLAISNELQEDGYKGLVGYIQDMGHRWIAERTPPGPALEIGFGIGRHSLFFLGSIEDYYVSEYSPWHTSSKAWKELKGHAVRCDARNLPYRKGCFHSIISIYNLEHIADLDSVLKEAHRVLKPNGQFLIALPCEDGLIWNIGREITTRRQVQKRKDINYDKIIAFEHIWSFPDLLKKITGSKLFHLECMKMFPFGIRFHHVNLIACLQCSVVK